MSRRAGIIFFKVDGTQYDAKGNFTYNLGQPKREGIAGSDGVHGFTEKVQIPFIEGEITDRSDLDLAAMLNLDGVTVTLELGNGKVVLLRDAWYAAEGTGNSEEGNIQVRFEGKSGEEVT